MDTWKFLGRMPWILAVVVFAWGCGVLQKPPKPTVEQPVYQGEMEYTPVPTVPPRTPTPAGGKALPTRPVKNPEAERIRKSGKPIGPIVTFAGISRADGIELKPIGADPSGVPIFQNYVGSGFQMIIEGKPGISNLEVGRRTDGRTATDRTAQPDLQVQVTNDLGDGSREICDRRRPNIGGVPGIDPPSFAETKEVADTLNDMSCRFETFIESESACIVTKYGDFSFINPETTTQFCMIVARAWNFPVGDTLVSVRLRDVERNPGPVAKFWLRRPKDRPTPARPRIPKTPTPRRRRP